MTGKAYRICVSDTPAALAEQVTGLLSEGWRLYGYPFVGFQNRGNGNGHEPGGSFCQAMVRIPGEDNTILGEDPAGLAAVPIVRARTTPAAPVKPRPARPRVAVSFRNVAAFLAVIAGGYLLAEAILFRSGLYARFLEPESSTGSFERTFAMEAECKPSGKKEVLIVGNSRMAEGFSAKLANEYKPEDGFRFSNCAVPSAGARTVYYLIRALDPQHNRYAAITIPIDDYDDPDDYEDAADRTSDLHLLVNRLRFTDILPYAMSFTTWKSRLEVFRGALFKGTVYQRDLADFIEHPTQRLTRIREFREHGNDWAYGYNGLDRTMAGLAVDYAHRHVTYPPGIPEEFRQFLEGAFLSRPPQLGRIRAFEVRWLVPLVELYRGSKTRIIVFQAPRGPAPKPTVRLPWNSTDELRKRPWVTVLDRTTFERLEKPELFGDHVHLNSTGRKLFSPMLADVVRAALQAH